jgi:hypothetical protein
MINNMESIKQNSYRFSGHESFACRYTWLPKAAQAVDRDNTILSSTRIEDAMVQLGVGKNMVRSIRFWAEAADVITPTQTGHELTEFGKELLHGKNAKDPYLEDIKTLWLIHWKLATNKKALIFAWDYLLNDFHEPELYATAAIRAFSKVVPQISIKNVSSGSLEQLYEVFLHSYVPTRSQKGEIREDNLDCPLVELGLLQSVGFAQSAIHPGRWEAKYAFRREEKPEISPALFAYCLEEFCNNRFGSVEAKEQSISFDSIVVGHGSPGQIFKIPESDIRSRLYGLEKITDGYFVFEESASIPRVIRQENIKPLSLSEVYQLGEVCV